MIYKYQYNLAYIVDQVDERTFQARFFFYCGTDLIVTCYLSHELYYQNIRPLVGDLVKLEYNSGFRGSVHTIVEILFSKKEQDKFKKIAMPITRGVWTLRRLNHNYDSFTIKPFFGSKLSRLLYSTLGFKTVQDLVNVETLTLARAVFLFSEVDREEFNEIFENLVEFFESY